jgi:hypothetical protein
MDRIATLTEQIQDWYHHSPKAQRAYARVADDMATVSAWLGPKAHELWDRVAPLIDPPSKPNSANGNGAPDADGGLRS